LKEYNSVIQWYTLRYDTRFLSYILLLICESFSSWVFNVQVYICFRFIAYVGRLVGVIMTLSLR